MEVNCALSVRALYKKFTIFIEYNLYVYCMRDEKNTDNL